MRFNKHKDYNLPTEYRQFEKANQQYHKRNRRASVSFGVFISYILVTILAAALWTEGFGFWKEDSVRPENPMEAEENGSNGSDNGENGNQTSDFVVRFLDVGQGAAVLITTEGKSMLIDGGGPKRSSFVVSYLKSLGITKLDSIIATHYDNDHISGLVGALNVFGAEEVWGPDYESDTRTYLSFCRKLEELGLTRKTPLPGDTIHPTQECLKRLHQIGASIYRTDEQGTIRVAYGENNIQIGFEPDRKPYD